MIYANLSVRIPRKPFTFMTSYLQSSMTIQGGHRDTCIFSEAQEPNVGLGRLFIDVSRSHTIRHTHPVGLLSTSDQLVAEATTYTTHTKDEYPFP
jgi:hypothetical protein